MSLQVTLASGAFPSPHVKSANALTIERACRLINLVSKCILSLSWLYPGWTLFGCLFEAMGANAPIGGRCGCSVDISVGSKR